MVTSRYLHAARTCRRSVSKWTSQFVDKLTCRSVMTCLNGDGTRRHTPSPLNADRSRKNSRVGPGAVLTTRLAGLLELDVALSRIRRLRRRPTSLERLARHLREAGFTVNEHPIFGPTVHRPDSRDARLTSKPLSDPAGRLSPRIEPQCVSTAQTACCELTPAPESRENANYREHPDSVTISRFLDVPTSLARDLRRMGISPRSAGEGGKSVEVDVASETGKEMP